MVICRELPVRSQPHEGRAFPWHIVSGNSVNDGRLQNEEAPIDQAVIACRFFNKLLDFSTFNYGCAKTPLRIW